MRAEQTVSEMVVEALSGRTGQPFEEVFAEVLKTPAGRRPTGRASDGSHRHEKAAEWQAGLLREREAKRPAHLRQWESAQSPSQERYSWLGSYMDRVDGTDGREKYHAQLRERFASLVG